MLEGSARGGPLGFPGGAFEDAPQQPRAAGHGAIAVRASPAPFGPDAVGVAAGASSLPSELGFTGRDGLAVEPFDGVRRRRGRGLARARASE